MNADDGSSFFKKLLLVSEDRESLTLEKTCYLVLAKVRVQLSLSSP